MSFYSIKRELYTALESALKTEFKGISVTNKMTSLPSEFPCVSVVFNNTPSTANTTASNGNAFRDFYINVDVFCNSTKRKYEAEQISSFIQDFFCPMNFEVESDKVVDGINGATIYRLSITFVATVRSDGMLFSRR